MLITYQGKENLVIKTKNHAGIKVVKIGEQIFLGEIKITNPGEYESGGVQLEVIDGVIEILSEKMTIAWIKKAKVLSDEELEKLNGINVLLIGVGGGEFTETKTAIEVINQVEPQIVIPMYSQDPPAGRAGLESFTKEEPVSQTLDQFKFIHSDLPVEERKVIVLNPSI